MRELRPFRVATIVATAALAVVLSSGVSADTPTLLHHFTFDLDYSSSTSSVVADPLLTFTPIDSYFGKVGGSVYFTGYDSLLLLEGRDVLPAGAFTFAFWERASNATTGTTAAGYFVCDAASNPLQNLYLRRYPSPDSTGTDLSAVNGMIAESHFSQYVAEDISLDEWHQHTITYDDLGVGYWWVDGVLKTVTPTGVPFAGLSEILEGSDYNREGLVLGNRLTQDRTYEGNMDDWQIYQGAANGGMAQYLYNNPGATLATYDPVAYPDPGGVYPPGVRPDNAAVRRWKFDGNLNEHNGTAHGTAIGDAVAGTDNGAYAGSGAVAFDGIDDAVTIDLSGAATNKYSVALWAKDTSGTTGYLFADADDPQELLFRRFNDKNLGDGVYGLWGGGDALDNPNIVDPNTELPPTYDEWHHVVVAIDGEWGNARVYLDGTLARFENIEADWGYTTGFNVLSHLILGNRASDMARDYAGLLDDLQVYNWNLSEEDAAYLFEHPGATLFETVQVPGDASGNGYVGPEDAQILAANWLKAGEWAQGDFNDDGIVNDLDASIMAANWSPAPLEGAVPEPGTLVLLLGLAGLALLRRRRRKS
ncbi:MAG: PEP-CTERM sorting domain-containing protein [Pirellulales bacterium]|nr:PEP-CTERM sorting domain-containing protein [Pirellulales bacterium]